MGNILLSNGIRMPILSLGTYKIYGNTFQEVVKSAYSLGYRSFDTAWLYKNEKDLGKSFKNLDIKREDIFVTTKIDWKQFCFVYPKLGIWSPKIRKSINSCLNSSLHKLRTEYIDLYLIHWPNPYHYIYIWENLQNIPDAKIKSLGVADFLEYHIDKIYQATSSYPLVNQIELHPLNAQRDLVRYCKERGIQVQAHTPLAQGSPLLLENEVLRQIAKRHHKTVSQIVLRWIIQQGICVCPKSVHFNRLKENIEIFDFCLEESEMDEIFSLDKGLYFHNDPHKTL